MVDLLSWLCWHGNVCAWFDGLVTCLWRILCHKYASCCFVLCCVVLLFSYYHVKMNNSDNQTHTTAVLKILIIAYTCYRLLIIIIIDNLAFSTLSVCEKKKRANVAALCFWSPKVEYSNDVDLDFKILFTSNQTGKGCYPCLCRVPGAF